MNNEVLEDVKKLKAQIKELELKCEDLMNKEKVDYSVYGKLEVFADHKPRFTDCLGLCFKEKQGCIAMIEYLKSLKKVRIRIAELNEGWVPDFRSSDKTIIAVYLYQSKLDTYKTYVTQEQPKYLYLKSKKLGEQLIREMPGDLINVITGGEGL